MVADLTRYSACKVHPDTPDRPVPEGKAAAFPIPAPVDPVGRTADPTGDEPVRLFVWASA